MQKSDVVFEFTVAAKDLDEALAIVKEKTGAKCIIGTRATGDVVLVQVHGMSLSPGVRGELRRDLEEQVQVHHFSEGVAATELDF